MTRTPPQPAAAPPAHAVPKASASPARTPSSPDEAARLQASVGNQAVLRATRLIAEQRGRPLSSRERDRFEPLLGAPLGSVRVHDDARAHAAAGAVGAQAFTWRDDVVLGAGAAGDARADVLSHELVHVVSQRGAPPGPAQAIGSASDAIEHDTSRAAARLQLGLPAQIPADRAPAIRCLPPQRDGTPLVIYATDFGDAVRQFVAILDEIVFTNDARIIIVGETMLGVYGRHGEALGTFRLRSPVEPSSGVHVRPTADSPVLHPLLRSGDTYRSSANPSGGHLDLRADVDRPDELAALTRTAMTFLVVPAAAGTAPTPPAEAPPDPLMQFGAPGGANALAWPGAVVALTPQITASNTSGSFLMHLENNQGYTTLERVGNLMQPINYRWEVLKLDAQFRRVRGGTRTATRGDAIDFQFERRRRDVEADRRTMLGEHPERQSVPESVIRRAIADQVAEQRQTLAIAGQVALTVVHVLTDHPDNPFSEDIIDVPFREPGDYFVRCLATPVSSPGDAIRRGTTVAGVSVSVFDIAEFAADTLGTDATDRTRAITRAAAIDAELAAPPDEHDQAPRAVASRARARAFLGFERTYQQAVVYAAGDRAAVMAAELAYVRARLAWLAHEGAQFTDPAATADNLHLAERLRPEEERLAGLTARSTERLGGDVTHTATMQALMVDEQSGLRTPLTFSIGERQYVSTDRLEVVIADVTDRENGRVFNGMGDGFLGAGREPALRAAMRDLRANLHRGRGYLAYRVPPVYQRFDLDLPNPMQLQMSATDQVVEMIDDAAHVATLGALLAAPFTGGASLEILAVLAPLQAGTSLYRILNRSAYGDLHLDSQAISDFINIASFGLGGAGSVNRLASRGVQIAASLHGVAVLLCEYGNYVVMAWDFFRRMMAPPTSSDPREARRERLLALLSAFEGAAIPIAGHAFGGEQAPEPQPRRGGEPAHVEPAHVEPPTPPGEPRPAQPTELSRRVTDEMLARPEMSPGARLADHPDLRRGLPSDLAGSLPIVVETSPHFGDRTVWVEYRMENGVITDLQLRVGSNATARNIAEHVNTVRAMQRYQGFSGRVRILLERVTNWFRANPDAPVGSRAWEARLELQKLPPIIEARARELADPRTSPEHRADLIREIADLEAQLAEHAADVDAMVTEPGYGRVAAEGYTTGAEEARNRGFPRLPDPRRTATDGTAMVGYHWRYTEGRLEVVNREGEGPKMLYDERTRRFYPDPGGREPAPPFAAGTTRADAYRALGGRDSDLSFGQYTQMLINEGLARDHTEIQRQLQAPAGVTPDTVRGNLKAIYRDRIIDHLRSPERLRTTDVYRRLRRQGMGAEDALQAAGHAEMVRVTRGLDSGDRGALAERWYALQAGTPDAPTQITITREIARDAGVTIDQTVRLDRVDGGMIHEIKNVATALGAEDLSQIDAQLRLAGHDIPVRGQSTHIDYVQVALLDPAGAVANASAFFERLAPGHPNAEHLIVEIHSNNGRTMLVTTDNRAILGDPARLARFITTGRP